MIKATKCFIITFAVIFILFSFSHTKFNQSQRKEVELLNEMSNISEDKTFSGLKFSFDTCYVKLLEKLDISEIVNGKEVIGGDGISFGDGGVFGYKVHVKKVIIDKVIMPQQVDQSLNEISATETSTRTIMKNMHLEFLTDFDASVSWFSDSVTNSRITVDLDSIDIEYYFHSGQIDFKVLEVDIKSVDIEFNSILYRTFYSIFKGLIIKQIEKMVPQTKATMAKYINDFINKNTVIKVPVVSLYFNATDTEDPTIHLFEKEDKTRRALFAEDISKNKPKYRYEPEEEMKENPLGLKNEHLYKIFKIVLNQYLGLPEELIINQDQALNKKIKIEDSENIKSNSLALNSLMAKKIDLDATTKHGFLELGISGYAFIDEKAVPSFPAAVDMKFRDDDYLRGVSILISDFTFNSLLKIAQASGFLRKKLDEYSNIPGLPFTLDTVGLQVLLPELKGRYGDKKLPATMEADIPGIANFPQPTIGTATNYIHFKSQFRFNMEVQESDDPFDDPVQVLKLEGQLVCNFALDFKDDLLDININNAKVENIDVKNTVFDPLNIKVFNDQLNNLIYTALDSLIKPKITGIDLNDILAKKVPQLPFKFKNAEWDLKNQYNSISFNAETK